MKVNITLEVYADERECLDEIKHYCQNIIGSIVDDGVKHMLEDGYFVTGDRAKTIKFEEGNVLVHSYPWNKEKGGM
jgi:hypothetical protein